METKSSTKNLDAKLSYEAPMLRSIEVELEEGIASVSGNIEVQQQWKETETQSQDVQNSCYVYWQWRPGYYRIDGDHPP